MFEHHPIFEPPNNVDTKIWRYIDVAKFVSILEKHALFFVRASKLEDPYEGMISNFNEKAREQVYRPIQKKFETEEKFQNFLKSITSVKDYYVTLKDKMLINSWHLNDYESASMWKLYSEGKYGIAIQSTFSKLCDSFQKNINDRIHVGVVKYLDYDNEWMNEGNLFHPFISKRKSFDSEKELRAIFWLDNSNEFCHTKDQAMLFRNTINQSGKYVPVDLEILINKIFVSPSAEKWVYDIVESLTKKYHLTKEVIQSDLYSLK